MTETLRRIFESEADTLAIPAPPASEILARGKGVRRRRRLAAGGVGLAAAAVVAAGVVVVSDRGPATDPTLAAQQYANQGAFALGRDIYIGEQHIVWDQEVKAIYYSSVGVVVRSGASPETGEGPSRYAVVSPTGEIEPLDVSMADRIPGFEPDSDRFAYADNATRDSIDVVVFDITAREEVARVTIEGDFTWGGWEAPPVSIDGDHVFVNVYPDGWIDVDWRTGEQRVVPGTEMVFESANGRYATRDEQDVWTIHDWADGAEVGVLPLREGWYGFFSPDGRYLKAFDNMDMEPDSEIVYDVATGESYEYDAPMDEDFDMGWTPDGDLLIVDGDTVRVCAPVTGECRERAIDDNGGGIKIGGNPYEA